MLSFFEERVGHLKGFKVGVNIGSGGRGVYLNRNKDLSCVWSKIGS